MPCLHDPSCMNGLPQTYPRGTNMKLYLADRHAMLNDGLRHRFKDMCPDMDVVGEAREVASILRDLCRVTPDVIVVDAALLSPDPIAILDRIASRQPGARVVLLTGNDDTTGHHEWLAEGVDACVSPRASFGDLCGALERLRRGNSSMSIDRPAEHPEPKVTYAWNDRIAWPACACVNEGRVAALAS